jgi:flagellin-specific chaperone FliS
MVMIFNGVVKILNKAIKCSEAKDFEGRNTNLQDAAEAFNNLRMGIDIDSGEPAKVLDAFCLNISNKISFVNIGSSEDSELHNIIEAINQVKDLFEEKQNPAE